MPVLKADGFDDALIGLGQQFNTELAIYDRSRCITILMERDGMTEEEAEEYFEFNVQGAYVGPQTPVFVNLMSARMLDEQMEEEDD